MTWNPSDLLNITLTGSNLIATGNSASAGGVRGTTSHSTGKYQLRFTNVTFVGGYDMIGIGDSSVVLGAENGAYNLLMLVSGGTAYGNNTSYGGGPHTSANCTVDMCVDFGVSDPGHNLAWYSVDGGTTWNAGGTANPATGVGGWEFYLPGVGLDTSNPASYFPFVELTNTGATATLDTLITSGLVSGFSSWDPTSPTGTWATIEAPDTVVMGGYPGVFGVTGYMLFTENPDTMAMTGAGAIVGVWFSQEATDSFVASGGQPITGTWATTEAPDIFVAEGIGYGETGVWETTEAPDVFAAVGHGPVVGTFAITEIPDRFFALGAGATRPHGRRIFFAT